ncbi:MAG: hypothetical protein M1833_006841 [Piccolia ochrophora]|nr:MAG: hypothetical protein M1833_006841 [Piccolia ochrophora]
MAPNLFLLTRKAVAPHRWFCSKHRSQSARRASRCTEHWESPVAGTYEYLPGRGWYLIHRDDESPEKPTQREVVYYCKIIHRWILESELSDRTTWANVSTENGKMTQRRFFRMEDNVTWVNCWEDDGKFLPGPWQPWCFDKETSLFRKMLRKDEKQRASQAVSAG